MVAYTGIAPMYPANQAGVLAAGRIGYKNNKKCKYNR